MQDCRSSVPMAVAGSCSPPASEGHQPPWVQVHGEVLLGEPLPARQALARSSPTRPPQQGQGLAFPWDPSPEGCVLPARSVGVRRGIAIYLAIDCRTNAY